MNLNDIYVGIIDNFIFLFYLKNLKKAGYA